MAAERNDDAPAPVIDLEPILAQVKTGDPVGAAYRLQQAVGREVPGRLFYEAGSIALSRRDDLGEDALRFARIVFGEAVERDPDLGEAHHDLATTMRELGMAEDAVRHYRRALELLPDDADSLIGLGAAQCDAGHVDDAIKSLGRATEAHPESGQAFANLAIALEAAGRDEEAVGAYAKAVARFDAALVEAGDDEAAGEAAARRRWTMIQQAELLERLERWPQAVVLYRRLHEEEQAIEEAEEEAKAAAESAEEGGAAEPAEKGPPLADAPGPLPDGDAGETLLDSGEAPDGVTAAATAAAEAGADAGPAAAEGEEDEHDHEDEEAGRLGLERVFVRLVQLRRHDLALLVLDDLGGELADARTRSTYAIYDGGDGLATIMVERWDGGTREKIDPTAAKGRAK